MKSGLHHASQSSSRAVAHDHVRSTAASFPAPQVAQRSTGSASAPAQLEGEGWMQMLIDMAKEHPYVATGTALVVSLGTIGYLLSRRRNRQRAPTPLQKLTPVATHLGVAPQTLLDHLNQEDDGGLSDHQAQQFLNAYYDQKLDMQYTPRQLGLVPSKLTEGLQGTDRQKSDQLFQRLNAFGFTYSGSGTPVVDGFMKRSGDCNTLVKMYMAAAEVAGIPNVVKRSSHGFVLVAKHGIHGRPNKGNVKGDFCWFFEEHHWIEQAGQVYDVLFKTKQTPATYDLTSTKAHKGVTYYVFSNGWCFIRDTDVKEHLNTHLKSTEMGIVITGEHNTIQYINNHSW